MWCIVDTCFVLHLFLFQSDFSSRVVNNDHFLFWGDIVKTNEEGVDFHIQVTLLLNTVNYRVN